MTRTFYATLIVAVAAISLLALASALRWVGRSFPRFFPDPNLLVSDSWDEGWMGPKAGLDHRDRVLSVNGVPVYSTQEVLNLVRLREIGAVFTYTVERGAETKAITIPTMRFRWRDSVLFFATPYVSGLAYSLLGLLVYAQCPEVDIGRIFLLSCVSFTVFAVTLFDLLADHTFSRLWVVNLPFTVAAMLHLALIFPERHLPVRRRPHLQFAPHLPAGLLGGFSLIYFTAPRVRLALQWLAYAWGALGFIFIVMLMAYTYRRTRSPPVRRQAKVVLWATAITFVPSVTWAVVSIRYPLVGAQVVTPFFILFPASIAYAIVKYRLFRLERLISQGVVYCSLTALLALLYFALLTVTQSASQRLFGQRSLLLAFASVLLVAVLFEPLRSRLQSVVDRTFYRERVGYRGFLVDFARSLRTAVSLDDILAQLVVRVSQTMHIAHASVLLRSEAQGDYRLVQGRGLSEGMEISVRGDDPLIAGLRQGEMVDIEAVRGTLAR